jgi:hypothetical protein
MVIAAASSSKLFSDTGCSTLEGKQRTSVGQLPVVLWGQHFPASVGPEELRLSHEGSRLLRSFRVNLE